MQKNIIDLGWDRKETRGLVCREQGSRLIKVAPRTARDVSVTTPGFLEAGANISNQQLEETSLLENILSIIKRKFLDGNTRTPLLVNSVFDGDQI